MGVANTWRPEPAKHDPAPVLTNIRQCAAYRSPGAKTIRLRSMLDEGTADMCTPDRIIRRAWASKA
eukprot:CAMPEP_0172673696 /NCGR_PEP_ID=MMETSP1074-20121228/12307_1 /TAXON_ID=2916 /ORGANISM="Ceratium fusus, Strain PA161109" /LENGTH=65 /DNA_ID=CAMNT_0013491031 /DNA_START=401 /DNA_END=595 /DNA_ORIENTATION=-